jgi:hypothetical protein
VGSVLACASAGGHVGKRSLACESQQNATLVSPLHALHIFYFQGGITIATFFWRFAESLSSTYKSLWKNSMAYPNKMQCL